MSVPSPPVNESSASKPAVKSAVSSPEPPVTTTSFAVPAESRVTSKFPVKLVAVTAVAPAKALVTVRSLSPVTFTVEAPETIAVIWLAAEDEFIFRVSMPVLVLLPTVIVPIAPLAVVTLFLTLRV